MAYIICATDFKEAAFNAIQYSCGLCRQFNAELVIFHSVSISNKVFKLVSHADAGTAEKMNELVKKIHPYFPDVKVNGVVLAGHIAESLNDFTKKNGEPIVVVIGNNYSPSNPGFMDGNLLSIFKHLKCPVVAIPKGKSFEPIKRICFAFDNKIKGAEDALRRLRDFTITYNIELHIIIGWADEVMRDNLPEINALANSIVETAKPKHHFIPMKNLDAQIDEFAVKNHMHWLVVLPRTHSFLADMVHKSHTQVMVNNAHLPIMALHED